MNEQLAQQMAQMFASGQLQRAQTPQIGVAAGATGAVPAQRGLMAPTAGGMAPSAPTAAPSAPMFRGRASVAPLMQARMTGYFGRGRR